jgi:hypothetical protein
VFTASCTNARLHSLFANSEQENARLKAEVERLKEGNECLDQMHEKEMARSAFLCEQVERLTKAGEAMACALGAFHLLHRGKIDSTKQEDIVAWQAAKEGKQS